MAGVDRILQLKLIGDVSSINKTLTGTTSKLDTLASSASGWLKAAGIGAAIEGAAKLTEAIGGAWTGFREGEQAAGQLRTTWANLGLDGGALAGTIEDISGLALKLGTDDTASIDAFNMALKTTGDRSAAMDRLRIATDLVANGAAPNLTAAMGIIQMAAAGSSKTVDKFGLTAETAEGRVAQLGATVAGAATAAAALNPIGVGINAVAEGLETTIGALSTGDLDGAMQGVRDMGTALSETWTAVWPKIDTAMSNLIGSEHWENLKGTVGGALDAVSTTIAKLGLIWDGLAPHVQNAMTIITPLVEGLGVLVSETFAAITGILDAIGLLLKGDFSGAWTAMEGVVTDVVEGVKGAIGGVADFLGGLVPGILEAAGGVGGAILDGIVNGLKGVADAITQPIKDGINGLIDIWNGFEIPAIGPVRFGEGTIFDTGNIGPLGPWPFPDIPHMAKGGIVNRPTIAMIGEAGPEAVVPLGRHGGMGGGNTYNINVNVSPGANPVDTGRQIVEAIRAYERRSGPGWRAA